MKYGDLIQFDPIESVIQLLDANQKTAGRKLVESYVISQKIADTITDVLVPQLSFDDNVDHKGILVVGNYGSGKSHLMSVLSLVAEDESHIPFLRNQKVLKAASAIGGRFKVHRIEISSKMSLRGIITSEIEACLKALGIEFKFPPEEKVVNNKVALAEMMEAFAEKYPNQGLLIVVDELLDYLRSRGDHEIVHDLSFMREIGEFAKNSRFRFMAGVQEAVFDSGRFDHMADSLRRIKDRFFQVAIDRQDITFVVAERLLRKDANQSESIRKHLEPFSRFYGNMSERMEQFVRLFPVHPDYLAVFEKIGFAENRNALTTLSTAINKMLDTEVPEGLPGIITYDSYWDDIRSNPVFKSDRDIGDVIRVSGVLEDKVRTSFPRAKASYLPLAVRLIQGLSIQRLTTGGDIHVAMGPTSEQLRDQLMLFHPMVLEFESSEPSADLLALVQTTLENVLKTVNGQFLTRVVESDQYFLDVAKDVDYDAQIDKRTESLEGSDLDAAYYSAILHLMERVDDTTHVPGHKIWQHDLEWVERRVNRSGYLFFGAPNDRPTAQPDRDFYLYFIQPFAPPRYKDEEKHDEVFFALAEKDDALVGILKRFSGARSLAQISSGNTKTVYENKAEEALRDMRRWLKDKQLSAFNVTYRGKKKTLQEWTKGFAVRERAHLKNDETVNFREYVNVIAGFCLAPSFAEAYPQYPQFGTIVTDQNRRTICANAIKALVGGGRTKDATMMLDALKLLDGDRITASGSPYATEILAKLSAKGAGQVLNRQEILTGSMGVEIFEPGKFGLEPDLVAVVLSTLVHDGDIVLSITGAKVDSTNIQVLGEQSVEEISNFKLIMAPKDVNIPVLRDLFELLGIAPGQAQAAANGDEAAVRSMQAELTTLITGTLTLATGLETKISFWGQAVLRDEELEIARQQIGAVKTFAEGLAPYNTPGKLKNLSTTAADIAAQKDNVAGFRRLATLVERIADLNGVANYLWQAETVLRDDDPWSQKAKLARGEIQGQLSASLEAADVAKIRNRLNTLKADFITHYLSLHAKARLGMKESKTKAGLIDDTRLKQLELLSSIPILPSNELGAFRDGLGALKTCSSLVESNLATKPQCPHCDFSPKAEQLAFSSPTSALADLDQKLDVLLDAWSKRLREEFQDPITRADGLGLVPEKQRTRIITFADGGELPDPLDADFVSAMREALSGLSKVEITLPDLKSALLLGGSPATVDDLKKRFDQLITAHIKGKDKSKVRFVVIEKAD
jgi:energy-coupling factor transporter ATP-binding protein EcfA2